jgi:flagellar basal-body rod protein FlgC
MPNDIRLGLLPDPNQRLVRPMFRSLAISASGLSAQRMRMETIASNIANAETTHGPDGGPYKRRIVTLQAAGTGTGGAPTTAPAGQLPFTQEPFGIKPFAVPATGDTGGFEVPVLPVDDGQNGVAVSGVQEDQSEGPLVYDPSHPDANKDGYVRYPNVRITDELVDMMDARRVYEANATVFQSTKAMLRQAIDI